MAPSGRPEHHIKINYLPQLGSHQSRSGSSTGNISPIEQPASAGARYPIGTSVTGSGSQRLGASSPSKEFGSRLFPKRAREIQAQEGIGPQIWGSPTSGHSTPLRETIPESPNSDSFPDFEIPKEPIHPLPTGRRGRAGTVPSKFSPGGGIGDGVLSQSILPNGARASQVASPFQSPSANVSEAPSRGTSTPPNANHALSRFRAGSMPLRPAGLASSPSPFGPSIFSTNWNNSRNRASTLASIHSGSNGPTSPTPSSFSRDSLLDSDVKTLDYLGLVDSPQAGKAQLSNTDINSVLSNPSASGLQPATIAELAALNSLKNQSSRFRSFSVNAKEKYAENDADLDGDHYSNYDDPYSGTITPNDEAAAAAYVLQEEVRRHNLEVQAFANLASASRPRARTAGTLDLSSSRLMRNYVPTPSRLENTINANDTIPNEQEFDALTDAVRGMRMSGNMVMDTGDDGSLDAPSRALWLGNIPASTLVSSLTVIFSAYGPIESARVLTHKNCGFVNFENTESAIQAKGHLNGKEVFPGAGPIRIGYAKAPNAGETPGPNGGFSSPSPDPFKSSHGDGSGMGSGGLLGARKPADINAETAPAALATPDLQAMRGDIIQIVREFGSTEDEQIRITSNIDQAFSFDMYENEIPPIPEASHARMHDAPRLRETRKRIDNGTCSQPEIENTAMEMLPEIAELSSDYLGNTVVQKLFEYCSENVKEAMLTEIAPHLAEIGVHKNGTWAAQKIIDVARTPTQMRMIVNSLRPYGVALFLDQYGNYVMQCCLRFQSPLNDFIFDVMLSRLWEIAQGRFGARAMRACLESHHASKDQQRMMAAAIALHSVQLATNANGALLLTWFLDTCTFPRRRSVLAPRLVPHLVHLCTHKVAYLTVLKIINQRNEPEARDIILRALFFSPSDTILEDILSDHTCGATLIFKVLTTPFFDEQIRTDVVQNVRNVLVRLKAQPAQGYKRLMDEVGLPTRQSGIVRDAMDTGRAGLKHGVGMQPPLDTSFGAQYFPGMPQTPYTPSMNQQRAAGIDSAGTEPFGLNGINTPVFPTNQPVPVPPVTPHPQHQMQYQQAMAVASQHRPGQYFPNVNGMGNFGSPAAPSAPDAFRGNIPQVPAMPSPQAPVSQSGFSPGTPFGASAVPQNMYQYPMQYGALQQPPQQPIGVGQRRGRR